MVLCRFPTKFHQFLIIFQPDYSLIAPSTVANQEEWLRKFDLIYQKYGGSQEKEEMLCKKLAKKYGSTVKLLVATNMDARNPKKNKNTLHLNNSGTKVKDEHWFTLNDMERGSGITDFTSNRFDPFAALRANEQTLSDLYEYIKTAPRLDNIAKSRVLLPDFDPQRVVKTTPANSAKSKPDPEKIKTKKIPVLTTLASQFQTGPLSILYMCHVQRKRVRVLIRYVDCIRGTLTGYLLTFDKHMNMILTDVDEVYSPRMTKVVDLDENISKPELEIRRRQNNSKTSTSLNETDSYKADCENDSFSKRHWSVRQRYCPQLLVRGDNVVMVWRPDAEKTAPLNKSKNSAVGTPGSLNPDLPQKCISDQIHSQKRWRGYERSGKR